MRLIGDKLKASLLQDAFQGKLTKQLPEDGDARDLLKEIQAEKERLVKEKKIKEEKPLPVIKDREIPFDIPRNWVWVRFCEVLDVRDGTHDTPKYKNNGIPLITSKNLKNNSIEFEDVKFISEIDAKKINNRSKVDLGDIIFAMIGSIGNPVINTYSEYFCIKNLALFKNFSRKIESFYLYFYLLFAEKEMKQSAVGGVQSFISLTSLRKYIFPLPPLAEQRRIVDKLKTAIEKTDELKFFETKLSELEKSFPNKLKASLLQDAFQGKLTKQLPEDGDARDLLKEIKAEKERLVKEKKIKKEKPLPVIKDEEILFDIPKNWVWTRLGNITYNRGQKKPEKTFSYIDISSIDNTKQKLKKVLSIFEANESPIRARKIVKKGDVIYSTVRPYLLNTCIIDREIYPEPIASTGLAILCTINPILCHYVFYILISPFFNIFVNDNKNSKGVAYPAISETNLNSGLVPLPPLAEQRRIVDKLKTAIEKIESLNDSYVKI